MTIRLRILDHSITIIFNIVTINNYYHHDIKKIYTSKRVSIALHHTIQLILNNLKIQGALLLSSKYIVRCNLL